LELSIIYYIYPTTYLSNYSPTDLSACLYMGNTIVSLCLPFPCRNASHSDSSTEPILAVFLIASLNLPPVSPWLFPYLSLWLYPMYSPNFPSRSPASRCIHRYHQNSFFFYEACNTWTTVNFPGAARHQMSHWFML
jgi:hypothetical protein